MNSQKTKKPINIYLPGHTHSQIKVVSELGMMMSSIARIAINKYRNEDPGQWKESLGASKLRRVILYLDENSSDFLCKIAERSQLTRSEALRRIIEKYLDDHMQFIKMLF